MCAAGCGEGRGPPPKTPRAPNRSTRKGVEKPVPWERAGNPGRADLPVPPGHLSEELKQVVAQAGRGPDADTTAGAGAAQTRVQSRRALLAARGHWRGSGLRAAVGGAWQETQDGRAAEAPRVQTALWGVWLRSGTGEVREAARRGSCLKAGARSSCELQRGAWAGGGAEGGAEGGAVRGGRPRMGDGEADGPTWGPAEALSVLCPRGALGRGVWSEAPRG